MRRSPLSRRVLGGGLAGVLATGLAALTILAAAPAGAGTDDAPAVARQGLPDKSRRTVDVRHLQQGRPPAVPWIADQTLHDGATTVRLSGGTRAESFIKLTDGYVIRSPFDEQAGTWRLDFVRPNGRSTILDKGRVSAPGGRADRDRFLWTKSLVPPDGANVVNLYSGHGDGQPDSDGVTVGLVTRADYTPVGYLNYELGFLLTPEGPRADVAAYEPDSDMITNFASSVGVTAVSEARGLAAFVRDYDQQDRPCVATARVDFFDLTDLWRSCEITPISFSPDGRQAVAVDSRSDGLGFSELLIVSATTGVRRLQLDVGLTQQVVWERPGWLLFDAWTGTKVALVRCSVGGACERATPIRRHSPDEDPRSPYVLPHP
ncbi:hypothetical protein [Actinopolymorpha alba]|uniref:hypothetical protein n=1 Tax=Actinopolymorpha alba TaxID=533267 RepID=UPI000375E947|nr:hypothetical protein [Actinopolymorpha alba]